MLLTSSLALALSLSLPGSTPGDTCSASTAKASRAGEKNIVDTAVAAGSFKTLAAALHAANLVDALKGEGPFTVFAPTDAAFAALPKGTLDNLLDPKNKAALQAILTYHVVPGRVAAADVVKLHGATSLNGQRIDITSSDQGVTVDRAKIVQTDIRCANGIIHVIDAVILPSSKDLVTTAVDAGNFSILAKALGAAGLVEALSGKGPFTVFAPTDEAFGKLPSETLASLLEPANKAQLVAILKYHVVAGRVYADQLETAHGPKIGGAAVLKADVEASNGVIHVIDRVLIPGA